MRVKTKPIHPEERLFTAKKALQAQIMGCRDPLVCSDLFQAYDHLLVKSENLKRMQKERKDELTRET